MLPKEIRVERAGHVATVVLNRPEKFNALTRAMWLGLDEAMKQLSADDSLRCVVLRGAGGRSVQPCRCLGSELARPGDRGRDRSPPGP